VTFFEEKFEKIMLKKQQTLTINNAITLEKEDKTSKAFISSGYVSKNGCKWDLKACLTACTNERHTLGMRSWQSLNTGHLLFSIMIWKH